MDIRLIKTKKELDTFERDLEQRFFQEPKEYPCIAIYAVKDTTVDWKPNGFQLYKMYELKFLYPKEIQKELYEDDFEKALK